MLQTKTCTKCFLEQDILNYHFRDKTKDIRQTICKGCRGLADRKSYIKNKEKYKIRDSNSRNLRTKFLVDYLYENPCIDCGETNPLALDFDHIDPSTKKQKLSRMITNNASIEDMKKEIAKCEVRCANCHRVRTAFERAYARTKYLREEHKNI